MLTDSELSLIVSEVLKRLNARKKSALLIFTGAAIGFQESIAQLKNLQNDGWNFKVFLSKNAENVFTPELMKKQLGVKDVILEKDAKGLQDIYKGVSHFIIPTLTLNTAAKVSLGIADNMATNLVAHGIMEGIPITAVKDGCDLSNSVRLQLGMDKTPSSYLDMYNDHLNRLKSFGINLVNSNELGNSLSGRTTSTTSENNSNSTFTFSKKVLTRLDVFEVRKNHKALQVPKGTIITSLARDSAREIGLVLKEQ